GSGHVQRDLTLDLQRILDLAMGRGDFEGQFLGLIEHGRGAAGRRGQQGCKEKGTECGKRRRDGHAVISLTRRRRFSVALCHGTGTRESGPVRGQRRASASSTTLRSMNLASSSRLRAGRLLTEASQASSV